MSQRSNRRVIAQHRLTNPAQLHCAWRGELDWIVMKCLAMDRSRRYETAIGLARDVERHLQDEPVAAGPPCISNRLRKFARRNMGAIALLRVEAPWNSAFVDAVYLFLNSSL